MKFIRISALLLSVFWAVSSNAAIITISGLGSIDGNYNVTIIEETYTNLLNNGTIANSPWLTRNDASSFAEAYFSQVNEDYINSQFGYNLGPLFALAQYTLNSVLVDNFGACASFTPGFCGTFTSFNDFADSNRFYAVVSQVLMPASAPSTIMLFVVTLIGFGLYRKS